MSPLPRLRVRTDGPGIPNNSSPSRSNGGPGSVSPDAPPYSPITPVMASSPVPDSYNRSPFHSSPASSQPHALVPFDENDSSDAIALRSAISILQIQRQQSLRDLKTLERQKVAATNDPEAFATEIVAGRVKTTYAGGLDVGPKANNVASDSTVQGDGMQTDPDPGHERGSGSNRKFEDIPGPQNIVRAPHINWAKYHIVGEPLDKLHEEQRIRPTPGYPSSDKDIPRASESVIAAPYCPWTDTLAYAPLVNRNESKKE